jgi:hypothetical protein
LEFFLQAIPQDGVLFLVLLTAAGCPVGYQPQDGFYYHSSVRWWFDQDQPAAQR